MHAMWVHAADVRAAGRHALDGIGRDIEHFRGCGIPRGIVRPPTDTPFSAALTMHSSKFGFFSIGVQSASAGRDYSTVERPRRSDRDRQAREAPAGDARERAARRYTYSTISIYVHQYFRFNRSSRSYALTIDARHH